jgi:hypothetical protein
MIDVLLAKEMRDIFSAHFYWINVSSKCILTLFIHTSLVAGFILCPLRRSSVETLPGSRYPGIVPM